MVATLLRYWVLLPLVLVVIALIVIHISRQRQLRCLGTMADKTFERVPVGLIEMSEFELARKLSEKMLSFCLILLMTILTITANVHPSLKLPGLALWKVIRIFLFLKSKLNQQEHRFSEMAIVEKIYLLNSIFAVTMTGYLLSQALFYFKTWVPFWEAKAMLNGDGFRKPTLSLCKC